MRIDCETLDLRAFLCVNDLGSFHRAATVLNMSQPALSRRIKALEATMGTQLFERSTRRVRPTRTAQNFEVLARRLVDEFDYAMSRVGQPGKHETGQLTVAAIPTVAGSFLPSVLERFRESFPAMRLRILDLRGNEVLEAVARGEAEFGINFIGSSHHELEFTPLLDDVFKLVCRRDHPFARRRFVNWHELTGKPLVISQNNSNRMMIDQALSRSKISLNWTFEVMHLSTAFGLVASGTAMTIQPGLATYVDQPMLAGIPLGAPQVSRTIGIVALRKRSLSPAASNLRDLLLEAARHRSPSRRSSKAQPKNARTD